MKWWGFSLLCVYFFAQHCDCVFRGNGKVYITYGYEYSEQGIRVIYRPEQFETYSAVGYGNTARILLKRGVSPYIVKQEFNASLEAGTGWEDLEWESQGKYYYYDDYTPDLKPHDWIVYGIYIKNYENEFIYIDLEASYKAPFTIIYCELDKSATSRDIKCSDALDGKLTFTSTETTEYTSSENSGSTSLSTGGIVGIIVAVVVIIVIAVIVVIVVVCLKNNADRARFNSIVNKPADAPSVAIHQQPVNAYSTNPSNVTVVQQPAQNPGIWTTSNSVLPMQYTPFPQAHTQLMYAPPSAPPFQANQSPFARLNDTMETVSTAAEMTSNVIDVASSLAELANL